MKIFGLNITRSEKMAQPTLSGTVKVQDNPQESKPSIPLKSSFPKAELGDPGIRSNKGIITEEYNSQLQGIQGIKVFDEMRKSDGTVRATVLACTLPIRRAQWFVKPASDSKEDMDIAATVQKMLFDWIDDMSWDDILRQALLMVPLGVMVFEKVYGTKQFEGKTYVTLSKLAPRMPRSIYSWELTDGTLGIQQLRNDGFQAQIPMSKLVVFVNEMEGNNWWGTSMLRAAYKHWYYKNNFYKIDAIAFERQGIGIPKITMPKGYTETDERKATQAMQNLRANENAYLLLPPDYEAEFMDMGTTTTRDPSNSIMHHNREISKSVLAQFLELGATSSGSRSLSEDHSTLFLNSLEAIAKTVASEINKNLIKEIVDLNWDGIETYPELDFAGIDKVDIQKLSTAYSSLTTSGAITPTDNDQVYLRNVLGLPERTEEEIAEAEEAKNQLEEDMAGADPEEDDVDGAVEDTEDGTQSKADKKKTDTAVKKKDSKKAVASDHMHHALPRTFDDGNGFKSWRPFTFAEEKVSWKKIQDTMDKMEQDLSDDAKKLLNASKDAFMTKLHAALDTADTKAISELEVKFIADYKALLKDAMKKAYEYGKNNVSTEMGVAAPANTASTLANIDLMADTIANKTASDLEAKAKTTSANAIQQGKTALQAAGVIDLALEQAIDKAVDQAVAVAIGQAINYGRNDVFTRNQAMIHALQRSEILDTKTCNFCFSMDGKVVLPSDQWAQQGVFHSSCRGIWVEILKDEQGVEDIEVTGIPAEIGDYYAGQPNALVQPKKPIVDPGSPAAKEVERQEKAKAKKAKK